MSNTLPYKHIQEQTERQLLNIIVDKLCCISENTTANNEYKIAYYQEISDTTGTVTVPEGGTILLNQLAGGADALVSTIDGVPTGSFPQTAGGVMVDVTSFDVDGNWVLSGTPSAYPVALIYWLKISAADYSNLNINNIIEENIPLLVDNIYNTDGTLTGDRTITGDGNDLIFDGGGGALIVNSTAGITSKSPSNATIKIQRDDNVQYGAALRYFSGNTEKWVVGLSDAGDFAGSTGNEFFIGNAKTNPLFLINASQNIGIGTTTPVSIFHINGADGLTINNGGVIYPNIFRHSSDGGLLLRSYNAITSVYTNNLKITPSGNVGIGTTTPAYKLEVNGTSRLNGRVTLGGNVNNFIQGEGNNLLFNSVDNFSFVKGANTLVTIKDTGNVGIGTTSPAYKLDINGSFNALTSGVYLTYNSGILYHGNYYQYTSGNDYKLFARTSGGLILGSDDNERMRITSAGNVGIGTTSPTFSLDVVGNVRLTNASSQLIINNATYSELNYGAANYFRANGASAAINGPIIQFLTSGNEKLRITNTGNVGIGTTTPSAKIHTDNTATSGVGAIIENSNVTNTDDIIQFHNSTGKVASVTNEGYLNIKAATGTSDTVLILDGDVVQKKVLSGGAQKAIYSGSPYDLTAASTTEFFSIAGSSFIANSDVVWLPITSSGTFKNASLVTRFGQPADGSAVITLVVSGIGITSLSITVPANAASQSVLSDFVNQVHVNAGDLVYWQIQNNSPTASSCRITSISVEFEFD